MLWPTQADEPDEKRQKRAVSCLTAPPEGQPLLRMQRRKQLTERSMDCYTEIREDVRKSIDFLTPEIHTK